MTTLLVRLKPYDPRRGNVLQRFTFAGIKFHEARGWYRVEPEIAEYLRAVHQRPADPHTPLAFDVCTDDEAKALELRDKEAATPRKAATDDIQVTPARLDGAVMPPRKVMTDDAPLPGRVDEATFTPRKVGTEDAPLSGRVDGATPRRAATEDVPSPPARADRGAATANTSETGRDDRKPPPNAESPEPAKDDKKPAPAVAPRKDRP